MTIRSAVFGIETQPTRIVTWWAVGSQPTSPPLIDVSSNAEHPCSKVRYSVQCRDRLGARSVFSPVAAPSQFAEKQRTAFFFGKAERLARKCRGKTCNSYYPDDMNDHRFLLTTFGWLLACVDVSPTQDLQLRREAARIGWCVLGRLWCHLEFFVLRSSHSVCVHDLQT